jgi:hypothetical protein
MRWANCFLLITIIIIGLASCKKSTPAQVTSPDSIAINTGPDIYVAGTASNYSTNSTVAVYWKNNVCHKLTENLTKSGAVDMVMSDTNVYVAGYSIAQGNYIASATYWTNGIPATIGYNTGASSIAVQGSNVYVAFTGASAHGFDQPYYWKSGNFNPLTDGSAEAISKAILINGSDVYVTGGSANNSNNDDNVEATYWKNGVITKLVSSTIPTSSANAITVSGTDVYIAGYIRAQDGYEAVYWKNGAVVKLAVDPQYANAYSIAVQGTDVYVAGNVNQRGTYWKNGVLTTLSNGIINSMMFIGNDLYFTGTDNGRACYWKNGTKTQLSSVSGYSDYSASCKIAIVPH